MILLDDVFAELDPGRAVRLLDLLEAEERGQVLLTAPKASDLEPRGGRLPRWHIRGREDHRMSQKGRDPAPLGQVLAGYLERSGLARKMEEASVVPAWPELVGPAIAAVTTPLRVTDGVLIVAVRSSAWLMELRLMEGEILRRVNAGRRRGRLSRIRFVMGDR